MIIPVDAEGLDCRNCCMLKDGKCTIPDICKLKDQIYEVVDSEEDCELD
jgi:hypothetical protein